MSEELKPFPWRKWPQERFDTERRIVISNGYWINPGHYSRTGPEFECHWCYESDILAPLPKEGKE